MGKLESVLDFLSKPAVMFYEEYEEEEGEISAVKEQNRLLREENEKLKLVIQEMRRLSYKQKNVIDLK